MGKSEFLRGLEFLLLLVDLEDVVFFTIMTIIVIPHTKKVNVGFSLHFELIESFGLILC